MSEENKNGWFERLQERWNVSAKRAGIILIVFACTGFSIMFLRAPILELIVGDGEKQLWQSILYFVFILPIYNILLLVYGFIFGQFQFFWDFERRLFARMFGRRKSQNA